MKVKKQLIPSALYKKILAVMPIPCIDVVITSGKKFLLGRRKNQPAQGKWWFVGGRVFKGETLKVAVKRKIQEETGLKNFRAIQFLTTQETIFKSSRQGPASHTINSIFLVRTPPRAKFSPNSDNSELKWFSCVNPSWPLYVKTILYSIGFK